MVRQPRVQDQYQSFADVRSLQLSHLPVAHSRLASNCLFKHGCSYLGFLKSGISVFISHHASIATDTGTRHATNMKISLMQGQIKILFLGQSTQQIICFLNKFVTSEAIESDQVSDSVSVDW